MSYSTSGARHLPSRQDDSRERSPLPEVQSVVRKITDRFLIDGQLVKTLTLVGGHIHDSCLASYLEDGRINTYVHQRINRNVFQDPVRLMDNVSRVVAHVRAKLERSNCVDMERRVLTLIPGREGKPYCIDKEGKYWRTYRYIENTLTHDVVTPSLAHEAAAAFGNFVGLLQDLSGPRLHETIVNFHHTPKRYQDLCRAIDDDPHNRAETARSEIDFAVARQEMASILTDAQASGELPERIVHNDTKINNVLFDISSGKALCVIDLDTAMLGLMAYDFGDLVRTMTNPSREDERDLNQVHVDLPIFEAVTDGYLGSTRSFLDERELLFMVPAAIIMTYEAGIRFLTDYLQGDSYFKVDRPTHNLDRCRNQFKLISSMEAQRNAMEAIVKRAIRRSLSSLDAVRLGSVIGNKEKRGL